MTPSTPPRPHTPVLLNGIPFSALVDTGAVCSAISASALNTIPLPIDGPYPPDSLMGAGTAPLHTLGKYYIDITLQASEHLNQERRFVGWPITAIQTLETDVILGTDILEEAGATIDMTSKVVSFKQTTTISSISNKQQYSLPNNSYSSTVTQRYSLQPASTTMVSLRLTTPPGVTIRQGALVASHCTKQSPITNLDGIHTVRSDGTVRALWYNTNPVNTNLEVGDKLPGLIFQIIQQQEISKATQMLDSWTKPMAILTETNEPLCPDNKPRQGTLSEGKRKYLAQHSDLSGIEPHFRRMYKDFILLNHDIFSGSKYDVGLARRYRHRIDTSTEEPQFRMQFKLSPPHQQFLKATVEDLLQAKAITPCRSGYNAPVFAVPKQSGQGLRLVQDLRQLNEVTLDDRFSIMDTKQCLNKVGNSKPKVFSSLDLSASFWQLGLATESQHKTAFTLPFQNTQYKWLRTPMGTIGASSSFSRLMGEILGHIPGTTTYCDDCLISTPCHQSHLTALNAVASQLRRYNLKLNPDKCLIGQREVTFLGHKVNEQGIAPAVDKVAAIKAIPPPTTMGDLFQSIGLFNFFRGLVPEFAKRMAPLHRLTRKDSPWKTGPMPHDALTAFLSMRQTLAAGPVLKYPDFNRPFALFVDAAGGAALSHTDKGGIGALLAQPTSPKTEDFAPVAYFSRALKGSERRYSAFDLELLALTEALKHFQEYIAGQKTVVYTDHRPLSDATKASNSKTSMRLTDLLQTFDITVKYRKGRENGAADALSRSPMPKSIAIVDPAFFPIPPRSTPNLPQKQKEDSFIKMVISAKSGTPPANNHPQALLATKVANNAFMADDLWWICNTTRKEKIADSKARLLAPQTMIRHIISVAHSSPLAGHWAKERTMHKVIEGWWWPSIAEDVTKFIDTCKQCQQAKISESQNLHILTPWPAALRFNDRVHVDLVGPLISSEGPGRYIMSAVDAFSRWTMLTVLPCKTGKATRDAFFTKWICVWSAPRMIVTDNGKEFQNEAWKDMACGAGSKLHFVTPYHPAANGMVERFNKEIKAYMTSMVSADTKDWEDFIPTLMMASNCSYNRHIKTTPFQVVLSSLPNAPWSAPQISRDIYPQSTTLRQIMQGRQDVARQDKEQRMETAKLAHDKKHKKNTSFTTGQQVMVHHSTVPMGVNRKFFRPWWGPATVIQAYDNGTYLVQEPHRPDGTLSKLHRNRLKTFTPAEQDNFPTATSQVLQLQEDYQDPTPRRHEIIPHRTIPANQVYNQLNQPQDQAGHLDTDSEASSFHGFPSQQNSVAGGESFNGEDVFHDLDDDDDTLRADAQTNESNTDGAEPTGNTQPAPHYKVTSLHVSGPPMPVEGTQAHIDSAQPAQQPASALLGNIISSGVGNIISQFSNKQEETPSLQDKIPRQNPRREARQPGHFRKSDHTFIPH